VLGKPRMTGSYIKEPWGFLAYLSSTPGGKPTCGKTGGNLRHAGEPGTVPVEWDDWPPDRGDVRWKKKQDRGPLNATESVAKTRHVFLERHSRNRRFCVGKNLSLQWGKGRLKRSEKCAYQAGTLGVMKERPGNPEDDVDLFGEGKGITRWLRGRFWHPVALGELAPWSNRTFQGKFVDSRDYGGRINGRCLFKRKGTGCRSGISISGTGKRLKALVEGGTTN